MKMQIELDIKDDLTLQDFIDLQPILKTADICNDELHVTIAGDKIILIFEESDK